MSERDSGHGVPASSAHDGSSQTQQSTLTAPPPPTHSLQRTASASHVGSFPGSQRSGSGRSSGLELPPLSRARPASPGSLSPSATRIAGVSSILNPQDGEAQTGQRRKASQLHSPVSAAQQLPPLAPNVRNASVPASTGPQQGLSPRSSRRILTPRSPSGLHRAASLGQLNPQGANINAQQVPFPPSPRSRVYSVEPGTSGAPPLPTPPARAQPAGYGFPAPAPPSGTARRASEGNSRSRNLSSSASPSTSYSSYSQAGHTSPIGPYAPTTGASMLPTYSGAELGRHEQQTAGDQAASNAQRQMAIPISSSGGQNVYQMMTLETTSGTVQLPVDVQAASRVADEKRRRNAGASARFRQRRKEKEREASTSIARLELQVKELTEDAEFYRNERANLLSVLRGIPGTEQHQQRPMSPRQLRGSMGQMPPSMMSRRPSYMRPPESEPQSPETGRNVRRRTSTFSLPGAPPSGPLPPPPGPPLQPGYPPSGYTTPIAPQPSVGPLPSPMSRQPLPTPAQRPPGQQQQQQQQPPLGPPPVMQAQPQTGPYNPYERKYSEPGPREGR